MDKFRTMQLAGMLTESQILEAREDFIANSMGDKITQAYKKDNGQKPKFSTPLEIIQYLAKQTDANYIQWIARQYATGQFRLEDVNRIKNEIIEFNKVKPKLINKDLNSYKNLSALYTELEKFKDVDTTSNNQKVQSIKMEGVKKIIDTPNFKVLQLLTKEAACYYGSGTKWCTAADVNNQFDYYNNLGTIYVIIAGDRKFQLHMETNQFTDERDLEIEENDIKYLSKYTEYKDFLNMLIKKYYND